MYDNAGNSYSHSKSYGDYYSSDLSHDFYSEEYADQVVQRDLDFLSVAGIDVNSDAFNFQIVGTTPESTLPNVSLFQDQSLEDGVLDLTIGESSKLYFEGTIVDLDDQGGVGSGLSSLSLTLQDVSTKEQKGIYISSDDLDESGRFRLSLTSLMSDLDPGS